MDDCRIIEYFGHPDKTFAEVRREAEQSGATMCPFGPHWIAGTSPAMVAHMKVCQQDFYDALPWTEAFIPRTETVDLYTLVERRSIAEAAGI